MAVVPMEGLNAAMLLEVTTSPGVLHGAYLALYTTPMTLTPDLVYTDFTQPDSTNWTGYEPLACSWLVPFENNDGSFSANTQLVQFKGSALSESFSCYGYFVYELIGSTELIVLLAEAFADPIPITSADDAILVSAQLTAGGRDFGDGVVVS